MGRTLLAAMLLVVTAGCHDETRFRTGRLLGGVAISADMLNRGYELYTASCAGCHGATGGGDGPRARGLAPKPRDLKAGLFEFTSVEKGELPTDADLIRVIRHGLIGTSMTATTFDERDAESIADYVKTLSPRWLEAPVGKPVRPFEQLDTPQKRLAVHPYEDWVSLGGTTYHVQAKCWTCHPAYVPKEFIYDHTSNHVSTFPEPLYEARESPSAFGPLKATDFLAEYPRGGTSETAIYRAIAIGLGGTPMVSARGTLSDEQIWSLVYYVRSLLDEKDQGKAKEHRAALKEQANWKPGQ